MSDVEFIYFIDAQRAGLPFWVGRSRRKPPIIRSKTDQNIYLHISYTTFTHHSASRTIIETPCRTSLPDTLPVRPCLAHARHTHHALHTHDVLDSMHLLPMRRRTQALALVSCRQIRVLLVALGAETCRLLYLVRHKRYGCSSCGSCEAWCWRRRRRIERFGRSLA